MTAIRALLVVLALALAAVRPDAQQASAAKWDITAPIGPTSTASFETSEGTWMNVDVSPDGSRLVFDLLGDLYTMPIAGSGNGRATRLTTGPAFEMQPRFSLFTNSELVRTGAKLGPRLFSTGTILYGAETPFKATIETEEDAVSHLRRLKAAGAFSVKSYNQQRRDVRQMILKAARALEMNVVPEGGSLLYHDLTMITDGHTTIEHSLPVAHVYQDVMGLWSRTKVAYTPTLIVGFGGLSGEFFWYERDNVWEHPRLLAFTPREIVDARSRRRIKAAGDDDFNHVAIARHAKRLADAGVTINMGAHGQLQGLGAHWEIWMMAQGGMSPAQALATATINAARSPGFEREIGSLETGKLADLVVLDRNPLENIRNTDSIAMVMVNGRLYDAATLNEVHTGARTRLPLYWEGR